jgi:hypothetical protein
MLWGALGLLACASIAFLIYWQSRSKPEPAPGTFPPQLPPSSQAPIPEEAKPPGGDEIHRGKVAIVIDDMGYDRKTFHALMDLGVPLTFSILPGLKYSSAIATEAKKRSYEIMLHIPMEPEDPAQDPGQGAIRKGMSLDEVRLQTRRDLQAVPFVAGVNNHMGSRVTQDKEAMSAVLEEVRKDGLYFLDSKTSPHSVAYQVAKSMGIPAAERQVFLDDDPDLRQIHQQMDHLEKIAAKRGEAIAIGHPRPHTLQVLKERIPALRKKGYELVFLSELVERR